MTEKEDSKTAGGNSSDANAAEADETLELKTETKTEIDNNESPKTEESTGVKQISGDTKKGRPKMKEHPKGEIKTAIERAGLKKRPLSRQDSLKEFLVMNDASGKRLTLENEGLDSVISKHEAELTDDERMLLYDKAMSFKGLGSNNHALLCFLGCLKGLKPSSKSKFTMLPQCLTHISEIYALAGDYQRAVEFMQGTKLYYETAIIEAGMQVDKYKEKGGDEYRPLDFDPCLDEAKRANEYERLASSCLEQKKFQLALEYCGKATKLRQTAYGDEHPLTVKSLDLFTLIYAEMGKSQYSEAMSKVGDIVKEMREERQQQNAEKDNKGASEGARADESTKAVSSKDGKSDTETKDDKQAAAEKAEEAEAETREGEKGKHVTFKEPIAAAADTNQVAPLNNFTIRQVFVFIVVSAVLAILMTVGWCYVSESTSCPSRGYFYTKAKFFYYSYLIPSDPDLNYV